VARGWWRLRIISRATSKASKATGGSFSGGVLPPQAQGP
jgi:hypothetical protein